MDKRYTKPIPIVYCHEWKRQPTFQERCEAHPDHQTGMVTHEMIQARLREESEDLRAENERLREAVERALSVEESVTMGQEKELRVGYREMLRAALTGAAP